MFPWSGLTDVGFSALVAVSYEFRPKRNGLSIRRSGLPHHHSDPFDRILKAQAHDLTLVIKDEKMSLYDIKILWR